MISAALKTESIHAIKYKIFPDPTLEAYLNQCSQAALQFSSWLRQCMDSNLDDIRDIMDYFCHEPVQQAVSNLHRFLSYTNYQYTGDSSPNADDSPPQVRRKKAKAAAERLYRRKVLPLPFFLALPKHTRGQVCHSSLAHWQSWLECDTRARDTYEQAQAELEKSLQEIDENLFKSFLAWVEACEDLDYFKLSPRVAARLGRGGATRYYRQGALDLLAKLFPAWAEPCREANLLTRFTEIEMMKRRLGWVKTVPSWMTPLKTGASWTPPGTNADSINLFFGYGLPRFRLALLQGRWGHASPNIDLELDKGSWLRLSVCEKQGGSANGIIDLISCQSIENTKYRLTFKRWGRELVGECNTINIHKHNGSYFAQLAIRFPNPPSPGHLCSISPDSRGRSDYSILEKVLKYFRSSRIKEPYEPAEACGLKVMAVDLGISHPAACAFLEYTDRGPYVLDDVILGDPGTLGKKLLRDISILREDFIALRKELSEASRNGMVTTANKGPYQEKSDVLRDRLDVIRSGFVFMGQPDRSWLKWAALVKLAIGVMKKLHCLAIDPKVDRPDRQQLFSRWYRYLQRFKRNLLKKLARNLSKLAVEKGVHVVVVEDLSHFRSSLVREKRDNDLLTLWAHRSIVEALKGSLEVHGIALEQVDPRYTSQLDPETGEFGYRDKWPRHGDLWVKRDSMVVRLDCDRAAARNIGLRYLTCYEDLVYVKALALENGGLLPVAYNYGEVGLRTQGAFLKALGSPYAVFVPQDRGFYRPRPLTKNEYHKLLRRARKPEGGVSELFKHGGLYCLRPKHYELVNAIATGIKGYNNGQAPTKIRGAAKEKKGGSVKTQTQVHSL